MSDWPTDRVITVADWWYCGDEYCCCCCCSQPRIRRLVPPVTRDEWGYRWADGKTLERGPMLSSPDSEELKEQWGWMLEAARRHRVDNLAEIEEEAASWLEPS